MLAIGHLLIGCILGLLIYQRFGHRWAVPVAALGAILPDLIDKPLGHIFLNVTLDSGRIYAHSLLFLGIVLVAGAAYYRYRSSSLLLVLGAGIVTHLVLDGMWSTPNTLFWPALGDFIPHHYPEYFENMFLTEMTTPLEWLAGLSLAAVALELYGRSTNGLSESFLYNVAALRLPLFVLLVLQGGLVLASALFTQYADPLDLQSTLISGSVALIGGFALIYWDGAVKRSGMLVGG